MADDQKDYLSLFKMTGPPEQSWLSGNGTTCWEAYFFVFL
jgi:hypothetical protein